MTTEYQSVDIVKLGPDAKAQFVSIRDPEMSVTMTDGVTVTKSYYRLENGQPTAFVVPLDCDDSPVGGSYTYKTSGYVGGGGVAAFQKVAQPSWNQHYLSAQQSPHRTWTAAVLQPQSADVIPPYFFPTAAQASQTHVQNSVSYPYAANGSQTWPTPTPAGYDTYSQEALAAQYKKYISSVGVQHEDLIMAPDHGKGIRVTASTMSTKSRCSSHAQSVKTLTRVPAKQPAPQKGGLWCGC